MNSKIRKILTITSVIAIMGTSMPLTVMANNEVNNVDEVRFNIESTEEFDSKVKYGDDISFKDENLRNAVAKELNTSGEDDFKITQENIKGLDTLQYGLDDSLPQEKKIKKLDGLEYAINLQELNLGSNQITEISSLKDLTKLEKLYLGGNQITDLSSMANLTSLKTLDLSHNKISNVEPIKELKNSTSLEMLDLSDNKISNIDRIKELKDLKIYELNLSKNQITDISSVASLKTLYDLDLSNNQIKTLQPIEELKDLRILYLKNNQITDLSPITSNTKLFTLDASGNQLSDIGALSKLGALEYLYLNNNQIKDISTIKDLEQLKSVNLVNNQIKDIPENLGLEKLEIFDLSGNHISEVKSIDGLNKLRILDLSKNHISDLKSIENSIKNLKFFNASGQKIIIDLKNFDKQTIENPVKEQGTEFVKDEPNDKYDVKNGSITIKEKIDKDEIIIKFDTKKYGLKTVYEGGFEVEARTVDDHEADLKGEIILKGPKKAEKIIPIPQVEAEKEIVAWGGTYDLTDNIKDLPKGATVKDITAHAIDTKKSGNYEGLVEVAFENGTKRKVKVPVEVLKREIDKKEEPKPTPKPVDPVVPNDDYLINDEPKTPTYPVKAVVPQEDTLHYIFKIHEDKYIQVKNGNTKEHDMDVAPVIKNDRTMLPLRYVAEALDAKVEWNNETRTATFIKDGLKAEIQIDGDEIILSNGEKIKMDHKPLNINSRILVPVVNVANVFDMTNGNTDDGVDQDIEWDKTLRTVTIYVRR